MPEFLTRFGRGKLMQSVFNYDHYLSGGKLENRVRRTRASPPPDTCHMLGANMKIYSIRLLVFGVRPRAVPPTIFTAFPVLFWWAHCCYYFGRTPLYYSKPSEFFLPATPFMHFAFRLFRSTERIWKNPTPAILRCQIILFCISNESSTFFFF